MEAGISNHIWSIEELVSLLDSNVKDKVARTMNRRQRRNAKRAAKRREKQASAKDKEFQTGKRHKLQQVPKPPPKRTSRYLSRLWKSLLAAIAVVGFAYQFRPEINVDKDVSLNVRDPFAMQFRVTNTGLLSAYDLMFSCTVNNPALRDVTTEGAVGLKAVAILESKESTTKNCGISAESFPFLSNLFFDVTYRPEWFWKSVVKRTRFVNMRNSQGNLEWVKQPLSSK